MTMNAKRQIPTTRTDKVLAAFSKGYRSVRVHRDREECLETWPPPQTVSKGRVLAHNHVRHTVDMHSGRNGFRAWTWPKENKPRGWVRCGCGWSGLPHYALSDHARRYQCETEFVVASFND
jgi:hypothetical protein